MAILTAGVCGLACAYADVRRRQIRLRKLSRVPVLIGMDILCAAAAFALVGGVLAEFFLQPPRNPVPAGLALLLWAATFLFLWNEGSRANQFQRPAGIVTGEFFILEGAAWLMYRALLSRRFHYDLPGICGILSGSLLLLWIVPRFLSRREEHRILDRISQQGEAQQPEYTPPTPECPHPERWTMQDSMTAEVEILEFLKQLVITLKPQLIVETGTFIAASTIKMAEGLKANGFGKIITCEFDPAVFAKAKERIEASGAAEWIEARNESSLEMKIDGQIDLFFSDSHLPIREAEIRRFLPQITPNGLIVMHDASTHYRIAREAAFRLEQDGLLSMVLVPTPRGLMIGQKREGRR